MTDSVFDVLDSEKIWTFEDEDFLREWFFKVPIENCAFGLRRSAYDACRKAVFMGLLLRIDDGFDKTKPKMELNKIG